jgi:hypothetical protein
MRRLQVVLIQERSHDDATYVCIGPVRCGGATSTDPIANTGYSANTGPSANTSPTPGTSPNSTTSSTRG